MINIVKGDITKLNVDAIVNASDKRLSGGGGIDKAIHVAAGIKLKKELRGKKIDTGEVILTLGYNLKAKYVIHTAGPICKAGIVTPEKEKELARCYTLSLDKAKENNLKSIAFPCISTGIYKFPKELASRIAVATVKEWLQNNNYDLNVTFVCFDEFSFFLYKKII